MSQQADTQSAADFQRIDVFVRIVLSFGTHTYFDIIKTLAGSESPRDVYAEHRTVIDAVLEPYTFDAVFAERTCFTDIIDAKSASPMPDLWLRYDTASEAVLIQSKKMHGNFHGIYQRVDGYKVLTVTSSRYAYVVYCVRTYHPFYIVIQHSILPTAQGRNFWVDEDKTANVLRKQHVLSGIL